MYKYGLFHYIYLNLYDFQHERKRCLTTDSDHNDGFWTVSKDTLTDIEKIYDKIKNTKDDVIWSCVQETTIITSVLLSYEKHKLSVRHDKNH